MIPAKWRREGEDILVEQHAFGVAYRLEEDGTFTELWRTEKWYSFEVFLSENGRYLVRMGPWNSGHTPKKTHLAVAFYKEGTLLKTYSTAELVKSKRAVLTTVSHYMWLARANHDIDDTPPDPEATLRLDYQNIFHLKTIDGIVYAFDATTGDIVRTTSPQ